MAHGGDGLVREVIVCALAAIGLLVILWAVVGALLLPFSIRKNCMVVYVRGNERRLEQQVRAFAWLTDCGLIRSRLLLVTPAGEDEAAALAERISRAYAWASCTCADCVQKTLETELFDREYK